MPPAILALLQPLLKAAADWAAQNLGPLLERFGIYLKGRSDQAARDTIRQLRQEGREASRAQRDAEEGQRDALAHEFSGDPRDDPGVRVRHPGEPPRL